VGALTDFSALIANPRLILLGAAAQFGIFATFMGSILLGFNIMEAASIGIIGGADGPTSIFLASKLAPHLLGSIALAAYSYMALVPVIQPPIMRLLTTKKERVIRMKSLRVVSKKEKIFFRSYLHHYFPNCPGIRGVAGNALFRQSAEGKRSYRPVGK
jgi:oxaloacetate decarboxylase beta subunit